MDEKFDAIIVGAGMAGNAAAYQLAKAGLQVVLIERGPYPGSKNLSGGVLYGRSLERLMPDFWQTAPVERAVTNHIISFISGEAYFNVDFKTGIFGRAPYNGFTVLRARFDRWMASRAEDAGAMLVTGIKVEKLLREGNRVAGVVAGEDELRADVVIAADGAAAFIPQEAGLRERIPAGHIAMGIKEVIGLPREVIEDRFHLAGNEGTAYSIVGFATQGVAGGGFLYTNLDTLSIGLVINLEELLASRLRPEAILDDFMSHPMVTPLIKGGKPLEFGAHLVPEGGTQMMPRLVSGGMLVVGDAAGLTVNNGFSVRGMDLAIESGIAAAEAVVEAKSKQDFSAAGLSIYEKKMEKSNVMADMHTYARAARFLKKERLYHAYPEFLSSLMTNIYRQDASPKMHLLPELMKSLKTSKLSLFDLVRDGWEGVHSL